MYSEPLITLFGKEYVTLYGICIALGIFCCILILFKFAKGRVDDVFIDFLFYNGIASIMLGFLSATLFQSVYNFIDARKVDPNAKFLFGGMTFIGGLIGGVVTFLAIYFIFRNLE